jgi:hypothetical protein
MGLSFASLSVVDPGQSAYLLSKLPGRIHMPLFSDGGNKWDYTDRSESSREPHCHTWNLIQSVWFLEVQRLQNVFVSLDLLRIIDEQEGEIRHRNSSLPIP